MATFDKADPRWIVKDRADGTNVNGWHWSEKNYTSWSKKRINELFTDAEVVSNALAICKTTKLSSFVGEAYLNTRKGKVIPGYDLVIKLAWEGE
mmetsp:Transcript_19924/g.50899  ORF Transcript_19924/g.50899 Transcript_19924/m.50899 type:complete len:94 (-) Transcript_19924:89-370(-)